MIFFTKIIVTQTHTHTYTHIHTYTQKENISYIKIHNIIFYIILFIVYSK